MRLRLLSLVIFFIALTGQPLFSQQLPVGVSGTVTDAGTGQPIPAVNISVNGSGTISNAAGEFRLMLPVQGQQDTLRLSCMGYRVKYLPIKDMLQKTGLVITLQRGSLELKEVTIAVKDPVKLIEAAVRRIPDNYINRPHQVSGFYRAVTTRDQDYMQISEAVFDIYSQGYNDPAGNQLYLVAVRHIMDEEACHGLDLGLKPDNLFSYDLVKQITSNKIFSKDGLKDNVFVFQGMVDYKGAPAYEITFDQREGVKKSLYRGKIYLDKTSLAFLKIEYGLSPRGLPYASYGNVVTKALMNVLDIHIAPRKEVLSVEYQELGGRWILSGVTNSATMNFRSKRRHYNFTSTTKVDYIITRVDTTVIAPASAGRRLGNNKLIEFQTTPLDAAFWRRNTIILPDFDAEAVAAMLKARNESGRLQKRGREKMKGMPPGPAARIDTMLSYYHQQKQFNGTALVKTKNGIILNKSYGNADIENHCPADSNTGYRIGSLAKSFTAIALLQLVEEGKLQLKDPVRKFLPDYVHGEVTIEQLLSHQSGIPNYTNNNGYLSRILHETFSLKELVTLFCSDSLEFAPGTQFAYSNSGYVLLACVVEQICGKPFATVLKEKVFLPAGMLHTYAGTDSAAGTKLATGYFYEKKEPVYNAANILGAAGIVSTAADLLRWEQALADGKLLSKDMMATMLQPHATYADWDAFYGYGWMIDQRLFAVTAEGHTITYHPGTDMGFYTMFARQPDSGNVVILLSNTGDFPRFDLTDMILTEINK